MAKKMRGGADIGFTRRHFAGEIGAVCLVALSFPVLLSPAIAGGGIGGSVSQSQEMDYGRQADAQIQKLYPASPDRDANAWVQRVGQRLVPNCDRPDISCTFRVIEDSSVNAFSVPGYVYISTGMLKLLSHDGNRDDELSAVIARELGHIGGRHIAKEIEEQQNDSWLGALAGVVTHGKVTTAADLGPDLYLLGHTSADECDADRRAVATLLRAGIDPSALVDFYHKLVAAQKQGTDVEYDLGSQERPLDRIPDVQRDIDADRAHGIPPAQCG